VEEYWSTTETTEQTLNWALHTIIFYWWKDGRISREYQSA